MIIISDATDMWVCGHVWVFMFIFFYSFSSFVLRSSSASVQFVAQSDAVSVKSCEHPKHEQSVIMRQRSWTTGSSSCSCWLRHRINFKEGFSLLRLRFFNHISVLSRRSWQGAVRRGVIWFQPARVLSVSGILQPKNSNARWELSWIMPAMADTYGCSLLAMDIWFHSRS